MLSFLIAGKPELIFARPDLQLIVRSLQMITRQPLIYEFGNPGQTAVWPVPASLDWDYLHLTAQTKETYFKILTLEVAIFAFKIIVKSGLEKFIRKSYKHSPRYCCPGLKISAKKVGLARSVRQKVRKVLDHFDFERI